MERFFCCRCSQLKQMDAGARIFRTGFYRVHMKLGTCSKCLAVEERLEQAVQAV